MSERPRLPISARHAFALAFDLAARRDALHSIVVPLLVWGPWILAPAVVELAYPGLDRGTMLLVTAGGKLVEFLAYVILAAMLRFRARSVFNTTAEVHPAPARECYANGLKRVPALYLAEVLRNVALGSPLSLALAASRSTGEAFRDLSLVVLTAALLAPLLYLGFKLSMMTEVVVLKPLGPIRAVERSFKLTEGRFERWLEMIAISVALILPIWFLMAVCYVAVPSSSLNVWFTLGTLLSAAVMPVVQYAWTFFYLRLEEIQPASRTDAEPGPHRLEPVAHWREGGAQPKLRLVERQPVPEDDEPDPDA